MKEGLEIPVSDRRRWGPREIVPIILVTLNIGALVWGAATMNASVNQLTLSVNKLDATVAHILSDFAEMKIEYARELGILKDFKARIERGQTQ